MHTDTIITVSENGSVFYENSQDFANDLLYFPFVKLLIPIQQKLQENCVCTAISYDGY